MKNSAWSICRSSCPPAITTAAIAPATAFLAKAWSPSICKRASANGTINWSITACGTWTSRARPSSPISSSTAVPSRRSRSPPSSAFLYVFDRETGQPIWPIEEKPVPQGRRAGRMVFADAAHSHQAARLTTIRASSIDDLIDFTPELRAEAEKLVSQYKIGPLFTPPSVSKADGTLGTIVSPGSLGRRQLAGRIVRSRHPHSCMCFRKLRHSAAA